MAGQAMAGSFFFSADLPSLVLYFSHLKLNSGRLAVYSCGCVKQHMGTFSYKVPR